MAFDPDQQDDDDRWADYVPEPATCDGTGWLPCTRVHSYCGGANPDCETRECEGCEACLCGDAIVSAHAVEYVCDLGKGHVGDHSQSCDGRSGATWRQSDDEVPWRRVITSGGA